MSGLFYHGIVVNVEYHMLPGLQVGHLQRTACPDGYCTVHAVPRVPPANGNGVNWSPMKSADQPTVAVTVHRTKCGM